MTDKIADVVNCVKDSDCYTDPRYPNQEDKESCCARIEITNWNTTSPKYIEYLANYKAYKANQLNLTESEKEKITLSPIGWTH